MKIHHRQRLLRCNESVVERWGSQLHMLWDGVAGWAAPRVVSRLFIRAAGYSGGEESNEIVRAITHHLAESRGMKAWTNRPSERLARQARRAFPRPGQEGVAQALAKHFRESQPSMEAQRARASPEALPEAAQEFVSQGRRKGNKLAPLLYLPRTAAAPSAQADELRAWARSEEGASWIAGRKRLWSAAPSTTVECRAANDCGVPQTQEDEDETRPAKEPRGSSSRTDGPRGQSK